MPKLKHVREAILVAHGANLINEEECLLLYDINKSMNLDLPFWSYENFDLDQLNEDECRSEFRFLSGDIYRMADASGFPAEFTCYNGVTVGSIGAICIFLKKFAYPCRCQDMIPQFARPVPQLCMISNVVLNFMYANWNHLLSSFEQDWLSRENLEQFANDVHRSGAPLQNCWGFVDGTVRPVCRPGQFQRMLYNGHKRVYSMRFQSVVAPNGLVPNLYGPVEGKRHDSGMLAESGLLDDLQLHSFAPNGDPLCIYGDPAYPLRVHLQAGFKGANLTPQQKEWNKQMSAVRVSVEWIFGDIINYFKFLDFKKNLQVGLSAVSKMYVVCALLHNARCCLYGNMTSSFFDTEAPILEEYFTR